MAMDDHYATLRVAPDADRRGDPVGLSRADAALSSRRERRSAGRGRGAKAINEAYACLRDPERRAFVRSRSRSRSTVRPGPAMERRFQRRRYRPRRPPAGHGLGGRRRRRLAAAEVGPADVVAGGRAGQCVDRHGDSFSATSATPPFAAPDDDPRITYVRMVAPAPPKPAETGRPRVGSMQVGPPERSAPRPGTRDRPRTTVVSDR